MTIIKIAIVLVTFALGVIVGINLKLLIYSIFSRYLKDMTDALERLVTYHKENVATAEMLRDINQTKCLNCGAADAMIFGYEESYFATCRACGDCTRRGETIEQAAINWHTQRK